MLIQLQPVQISLLWENIRQSVMKAHNVPIDSAPSYSTKLLENLLSGKFQRWIVYTKECEERQIVAIGVTSIIRDNMFDSKDLHVLSLYGYRTFTDDIAKESFRKLRQYAERNQCRNIVLSTNIDRVREIAEGLNFQPAASIYKQAV